jgi:hypothetical protein
MDAAKGKEGGMERELYSQTNTFWCKQRYAVAWKYSYIDLGPSAGRHAVVWLVEALCYKSESRGFDRCH